MSAEVRKKLMVVDDDYSMRSILKDALTSSGYDVSIAKNGEEAFDSLKDNPCDLVITDFVMPRVNGPELMAMTKEKFPDTGFIFITAYGTVETAVKTLKDGAFDFITKPFSISQIESRVQRYFEYISLVGENRALKRKLSDKEKYQVLIGESPGIKAIHSQIEIVCNSDAPVFIQGESGTGKEIIARTIHNTSNRADKPFIKINCSAIPETLYDSTFFGHEKGAFTSAIKQHKGLFEEADGGTLLLDEITETTPAMQAKLLRVLQENKINRVGSTKEIPVDVRIIATSNQSIADEIQEGNFRADLYYRLNVFPIVVPPLRERLEDVPLLVKHFLEKFNAKYKGKKKRIDQEIIDDLCRRDWPGNVRQLENLIERAILYAGNNIKLSLENFREDIIPHPPQESQPFSRNMSIAEMEKHLIISTLERTNNNRTRAAEILGINVRTLRNKLQQYSLETDN
ncbi:MAG: sigma-54-dependent transcriptional regulator [Fidelibacterota bacterium]